MYRCIHFYINKYIICTVLLLQLYVDLYCGTVTVIYIYNIYVC